MRADSAVRRTVQVDTSTKTLVMGMASGPGLIRPVTFLPSQLRTSVIWVRLVAVDPQSPDQVPVSGWPCCARHETAANSAASRQAAYNRFDEKRTANQFT